MNVKQIIVLRKDLNMRKGKMVAQGAHASMKVFLDRADFGYAFEDGRGIQVPSEDDPKQPGRSVMTIYLTEAMRTWAYCGSFTKVCLQADGEEELLALYKQALDAGLPCAVIQDSGKTEFGGVPTYTAMAIGPAESEEIDRITGHLKLW